ncbi:ArsR/SmtB family transcription factor [Halovenus rubra]|uniref:ArsR/SmtB family transcription factor n=2 Tax=Halovenus rubra TaxID=869890 RepID=A0ABD5X489_9EURY|nr:helix-turn-helix domain-containing protein [Halovenus rubra]
MTTHDETEEAFTALADSKRVAILRILWERESAATFTELREALGMRDSGKFNYHLDQLTGRFVSKTDNGYHLTIAGRLVYGSILSGAYTKEDSLEPIALAEPCPACGGSRTLTYSDETVRVECDSCKVSPSAGVPPGVFASYDRDAVPAVANRYFRTIVRQADNGFCWYCEGKTTPTIVLMSDILGKDVEHLGGSDELPVVQYGCERCGSSLTVNLGNSLLSHPAVVSFYYDHDINVQETSLWEFATWNTDRTRVLDSDPFRVSVSYHAGGERLDIIVNESLDVVETECLPE